jgi:phosphate starvation-inducible PhoH-like protein
MSKKNHGTQKHKKNEENTIEHNFQYQPIDLPSTIKLEVKCKNENQKKLIQSIKLNDVTVCTGPAGCGKTYLACYQALHLLKTNDNIKKIILVKSVTPLKSEEIGFLKGTLEEKLMPYLYSFTGNFEKLIGKELFNKLKENNYIEILPIAYMRGVSIDNAAILIDELQNISHDNLKTILTRLGENSKLILLGDPNQIDLKNKKDSSLISFINKIKINATTGVDVIEFTEDDIVRHRLTSYFISLFKEEKEKNPAFVPLDPPKTSKPILLIEQTNHFNLKKTLRERFLKLFE